MCVYEIDQQTNRISKDILDAAFYIHTHLGPGLLEKVYEDSLAHVLRQKGLIVEQQKILPVTFDSITIETGFRLDLLIEDKIIVELKSTDKIIPLHEAQMLTYLKLSNKTLGLILNFNVKSMKDGIKRIAMARNSDKNFV